MRKKDYSKSIFTRVIRIQSKHHDYLRDNKVPCKTMAGKLAVILERFIQHEDYVINHPSMQLTEQHLKTFKDLYKARFGLEIDDETARQIGLSLVGLVSTIYKPIKSKKTKPP